MTESPPSEEEIANFFAAYLNQDFVEEYGGPWETVAAYKKAEPQEIVLKAANEARGLRNSTSDEHSLRESMLHLGIGYAPWAEGWSSHAWLERLEVALRS